MKGILIPTFLSYADELACVKLALNHTAEEPVDKVKEDTWAVAVVPQHFQMCQWYLRTFKPFTAKRPTLLACSSLPNKAGATMKGVMLSQPSLRLVKTEAPWLRKVVYLYRSVKIFDSIE